MTQHRDIERVLDQWFGEGPDVSPDRVLDAVADRIERQPQRPAWRLLWRPFAMNAKVKVALVAATVLIAAVVGYNLLPVGSSNVGGPAASPAPTPSAAPPAASATVRACDLITATEVGTALNVSTPITLNPNPGGGNADVNYCVYSSAGAEFLGTSYRKSGGGPVFETWKSNTGVQAVTGLGDEAIWDPTQTTLFILKGPGLVSIEGTIGSKPITLEAARAVGAIMVGRM